LNAEIGSERYLAGRFYDPERQRRVRLGAAGYGLPAMFDVHDALHS